MKGIVAVLVFVINFGCFAAAEYRLFEENGMVGLKDTDGKVIIPAAFEALGWSDGSFSMIGDVVGYKLSTQWGLINLKKERITDPIYESLVRSEGDRVVVKRKVDAIHTRVGCIDLKGHVTVPLKYDGIKIHGLRAIAFVKDGTKFLYGVIDLNDNIIVPFKYQKIYTIGNLRFGIENSESKTALFSESGAQLTEFVIDSISPFRKDYAVIHQQFRQGLIDRDGKIVELPKYAEIESGYDGKIRARKANTWKLLDAQNKTMLTVECDNLIPSGEFFKTTQAHKQGLIDKKFEMVLPPDFDFIGEIQFNKFIVRKGKKYGILRTDKSTLIPITYDSVFLQNSFVLTKETLLGKPSWSLYDTFGIRKTEKTYEDVRPFNGKFFQVKNYERIGAINRYGREAIHCVYDSIIDFNDELMVVKFHGQYGIIDLEENWILPPQSHVAQLVDDRHYLIRSQGQTQFKSFDGNLIYFTDNNISVDDKKLVETLPDGTTKQISFEGVTINRTLPPDMEDTEIVLLEKEGYRGIKRDGRYGFIDQKGRLRIANRYEAIQNFSEGLAAIKILGKWGFVDKKESIVVNPSFEWVGDFHNGVSIVKRGGKFGLIDKEGNVILNIRYDGIERQPGGSYQIASDNLYGLASANGTLLLEPRFEYLQDCENGFIIVGQNKRWGLLTREGLSSIPLIYDHIEYLPDRNLYLALDKSEWENISLN